MARLQGMTQRQPVAKRDEGRPFTILQVGTVCDRKNQRLLIDALIKLKETKPASQYRCLFAGGIYEEHYAQALKEQMASHGILGNFKFLGWRDDIHDLMAASDILVMPSKDEGVPNTVQEAMALGLPVIVSAVGGLPEIVSHGITGWVLPLQDSEAWARQIQECICDPALCQVVSEAARAYAVGHFGTESWGREYAKVIKGSVCSAERP